MPRQLELDLFSEVLHAYSGPRCGAITNTDLYQTVASRCSIPDAALRERVPVGVAGQPCNNVDSDNQRRIADVLRRQEILAKNKKVSLPCS